MWWGWGHKHLLSAQNAVAQWAIFQTHLWGWQMLYQIICIGQSMLADRHLQRCCSDPVSCRCVLVCGDREQELKVYQARRSLEEALTADGLARAAENTRAMLEGKTAWLVRPHRRCFPAWPLALRKKMTVYPSVGRKNTVLSLSADISSISGLSLF